MRYLPKIQEKLPLIALKQLVGRKFLAPQRQDLTRTGCWSAGAPCSVRREKKMKHIRWFVSALLVFGLLASCSFINDNDSPAQGAREWINGVTNQDGNKTLKYTCLAQRENLQQAQMWVSAFSVLARLFTGPSTEIKGDISDLKFETINQSGNQAMVRVHGELRVAVLASAQAYQVDEQWQMARENDTWRWCGPNPNSTTQTAQTEEQVEGIRFEESLIQTSRDFINGILKDSPDGAAKYFNPQSSQPQDKPKEFTDPRWGKALLYSPLDTDRLKRCFEQIPFDRVDFNADADSWDVWISDQRTEGYTFTTINGSRATVAFYVRGSRFDSTARYLAGIFIAGCTTP
jgi:hypothetical protein